MKLFTVPPWQPWQKSAIVPAALLQRDYLSCSDRNTKIYFAVLLLFNSLTELSLVRLHVQADSRWIRQSLQTYGCIAREASEEDEESVAAAAAAIATAAAAAEAVEAAAAAGCSKLEHTSATLLQS
jgi:hypothetical protein